MSKELSRRTFVQGSALAGLGAAALGGSALFGCSSELAETGADGKAEPAPVEEKIVWNHCAINCPGRCALKLHVVDDEIVRELYNKT